ncbi:hypothetical protein [Ekhidna sp. To15]|uniref:hypothetical protein n=1 Tax=Ekhidna sp. To15 TaxID=3395267 RepID=UPI003F51D72F
MKAVLFFAAIVCFFNAKCQELKSFRYGLDMLRVEASKDSLIEDMKFNEGYDSNINVLRIDDLSGGRGDGPLIISSKKSIPTDSLMLSLELITMVLEDSVLNVFIDAVDKVATKFYNPEDFEFVVLRFTYRYEGKISQYYLTTPLYTSVVMRRLEKILKENYDSDVLKSYYRFLSWTQLFHYKDDALEEVIWRNPHEIKY